MWSNKTKENPEKNFRARRERTTTSTHMAPGPNRTPVTLSKDSAHTLRTTLSQAHNRGRNVPCKIHPTPPPLRSLHKFKHMHFIDLAAKIFLLFR